MPEKYSSININFHKGHLEKYKIRLQKINFSNPGASFIIFYRQNSYLEEDFPKYPLCEIICGNF